jgi:hypothetical protein
MHTVSKRLTALLLLVIAGLAACATPTPSPTVTATPTATATPVPTWTPTPVPTATPIPPAELKIDWPSTVSPLTPVPVEVALVAPPDIDAHAQISATVMDPEAKVYATFELAAADGERYQSAELLQLPLEPLPGYWWLILHVESRLPVVGKPAVFFEAASVAYRDLTGVLPEAVTLKVPQGFEVAAAQGDPWAGGRIWAHHDGEVSLWWAPGPTEALLLNNAIAMVEATYAADERYQSWPTVSEVVETTWQGRPAFQFPEHWPEPDGGEGQAWVIQGDDFWLYVLRVRTRNAAPPPSLHMQVARTFAFKEP